MTHAWLAALAAAVLAACDPAARELDIGARGPFYAATPWADPSDELYDPASLPRFDLELAPAALDALRRDPRTYVAATLRYRGEELPAVGVRLKGSASFRSMDEKPSFKLKLDEFRDGQALRGVTRLTWNNTVQDATFTAERLSYGFARAAGVPAPRANSALVYVNGAFYGVYTNVETQDEAFLARWFASSEGHLYEIGGADLVSGAEGTFELDGGGDDDDRADLAALIAALDGTAPDRFVAAVEPHLDLDQFLRFAAVEALAAHIDGYSFGGGEPNNVRLYRDPLAGQFVFLPTGMDQTMQPSPAEPLTASWVEPAPDLDPRAPTGRVLVQCVASPACLARWRAVLAEVTAVFEALDLPARAAVYAAQVRADVRADERKECDDAYVEEAQAAAREFLTGRAASVRAQSP